jgi:hypothetical protein
MGNMLSTGADWIAGKLIDSASDPVTYSRDSVSFNIDATKGSTAFDSDQGDGGFVRFESQDFIFKASQLFDRIGLPKDGDLIHDGTHNYEVLALSGAQPFRYCDRHRTLIRVHTKQIG